jgi:hypothetical protein
MTPRKKLIEVALPLEAINAASAREKSIRHGHPSTLHLWWARRPLDGCVPPRHSPRWVGPEQRAPARLSWPGCHGCRGTSTHASPISLGQAMTDGDPATA